MFFPIVLQRMPENTCSNFQLMTATFSMWHCFSLPVPCLSAATHKPFYSCLIDPHSNNVITGQVGPGSPIGLTYWIEPSGLYIIYCSRVEALTGNSQNWIYNSAYDEFLAPVPQLMAPCLFRVSAVFPRTANTAKCCCLLACRAPR